MAREQALARDGHSSGTPVARRLQQPTRTTRPGHRSRGNLGLRRNGLAPSLFGFAPGGVCPAVAVARNAVRSYRTFSPLPRPQPWRFVLCGTVPEVSPLARRFPAGRYPAPYVHGARTFLPGDLSVLAGAAVRPTDATRDGGAARPRQGPTRGGSVD